YVHAGEDIDLTAAKRLPLVIYRDLGLAIDVAGVAETKGAERFVIGAVGQDDHIAGMTAVFRDLIGAVSERAQHWPKSDYQRESQRHQERHAPADQQIANIVAERNLANDDEANEHGTRQTQRHQQEQGKGAHLILPRFEASSRKKKRSSRGINFLASGRC